MRGATGAILLLCALASCVAVASAQDAAARILSATLDPPSATVGDRVTLTIVVAHAPGADLSWAGFGADFGGLEAVDVPSPETAQSGGAATTTLRATLVPFDTGGRTIPPVEVRVSQAGAGRVLRTGPLTLEVRSVLAPGDRSLRPVKPQLDLPRAAPSPVVPALFVGSFALLTALGYALVARAHAISPPPLPAAPPAVFESPHARALAALAALAVDGELAPTYAAIAAVTRRYLSERFGFPAYAMTRRELEREMTARGIDRWPARVAANLLEQCDAVQFAGFRPAPERVQADLTAAREVVRLTTPPEDTEPQG